jgi:hypothetical protein
MLHCHLLQLHNSLQLQFALQVTYKFLEIAVGDEVVAVADDVPAQSHRVYSSFDGLQ